MKPKKIIVPKTLFEDLIDYASELKSERDWWKDEPRCNYHKQYEQLEKTIEEARKCFGH